MEAESGTLSWISTWAVPVVYGAIGLVLVRMARRVSRSRALLVALLYFAVFTVYVLDRIYSFVPL